jgi:hypothetical protein
LERLAHGRLVYAGIFHGYFHWGHYMAVLSTPAGSVQFDIKVPPLFRRHSGQLFPLPPLRYHPQA